jgi:hypothetical protein
MAKITITIEDCDDGLLMVSEPSMKDLVAKAQARKPLSIGEAIALAAWSAIAEQAALIGSAQSGRQH